MLGPAAAPPQQDLSLHEQWLTQLPTIQERRHDRWALPFAAVVDDQRADVRL